MARDYYETLGIDRGASDKEIRQAYRRLARQYHPDVNPGDKVAEAKFREINEANEVLSDPEKRKKYDRFGDNGKNADQLAQERQRQSTGPFVWDFGGQSPSGQRQSGFDDIVGDLLGGRGYGRTATSSRRRVHLEQPVEVTLDEAFVGTTRLIQIMDGLHGGGRRLEVKIPPGVDNGSRIRVRPDGASADEEFYLVVSVRPHERFERRRNDLHTQVSIPLVDVVLGGEIEVNTLKEKVFLKIPPETENGRSFRLSGKGMPSLSAPNNRGNLYVKVQVQVPRNLSEREKELFQELKAIRE